MSDVYFDDDDGEIPDVSRSSCVCIQGRPCSDPATCLDWESRFEIARSCARRNSTKLQTMTVEQLTLLRSGASVDLRDGEHEGESLIAMERCRCLEGRPCDDPYSCADWDNRFHVARLHGWIDHESEGSDNITAFATSSSSSSLLKNDEPQSDPCDIEPGSRESNHGEQL
jgi:hypothetical protein